MADTGTAWLDKEGLELVTSTIDAKPKKQKPSDPLGYTIELGVTSAKTYDLTKKQHGTILEAGATVWRRSLRQGEGPYVPQEMDMRKEPYAFSEIALYDEETGWIFGHVITDDEHYAVVKQLDRANNVAYYISHRFIQSRTGFQCNLAIRIHTDPMKVVWLVDGKVVRTVNPSEHFTIAKSEPPFRKVKLLFSHCHDNSVECPPEEENRHVHMIVSKAEMFTFTDGSVRIVGAEKVHPPPPCAGGGDWLVIPDHLVIRWEEVASVHKDTTTDRAVCVTRRDGTEIWVQLDDKEQATLAMRSLNPK